MLNVQMISAAADPIKTVENFTSRLKSSDFSPMLCLSICMLFTVPTDSVELSLSPALLENSDS